MGNDTQLAGINLATLHEKYIANLSGLISSAILITALFAVRVYVRGWVVRQLWLEDWTCLAAWLTQGLYLVTVFIMSEYGLGPNALENNVAKRSLMLKWQYAGMLLYIPACYLTKVTILLVIARVFAVQQPVAKGINTFMVLLGLAYLPVEVMKVAICIPIQAYWDATVVEPHCMNPRTVTVADLSIALVTDAVIISLPVILMRSLRLPRMKKIKITSLLVLGAGAIGLTVYRVYRVIVLAVTNPKPADYLILGLTTSFEMVIGMACACLPSINILIERRWPSTELISRNFSGGNTPWFQIERKARMSPKPGKESSLPIHTKTMNQTRLAASFDMQLAMLTGRPVEDSIQIGPQVQRIQSSEGWREGWLAPREYSHSSAALIDRTLNGDLIIPDVVWDGRTHNTKRY